MYCIIKGKGGCIEHTRPNIDSKVIVFLSRGKNNLSSSSFYLSETNIKDHLIKEYGTKLLSKYNFIKTQQI